MNFGVIQSKYLCVVVKANTGYEVAFPADVMHAYVSAGRKYPDGEYVGKPHFQVRTSDPSFTKLEHFRQAVRVSIDKAVADTIDPTVENIRSVLGKDTRYAVGRISDGIRSEGSNPYSGIDLTQLDAFSACVTQR